MRLHALRRLQGPSPLFLLLIGLALVALAVAFASSCSGRRITRRHSSRYRGTDRVPKGAGLYAARLADCAVCHTAPGGAPFAGGRAIESPVGTIYASNITARPSQRHRHLHAR